MLIFGTIVLLILQEVFSQQNQINVRRLEKPKKTSLVRVYATMLVQVTPDNADVLPTTTIDNADDSDREEAQLTGDQQLNEERFTGRGRNKTKTLTVKTSGVDQALVDDFIFTTKSTKIVKQSSDSSDINYVTTIAVCLMSLSLIILII